MSLRLYWKPMWGTDADIKRQRNEHGALLMSNERMEKIITEAYERGKTDGAPDSERDGVERFGAEVRKVIAQWSESLYEGSPEHLSVPKWSLEALLKDWNIPPDEPSQDAQSV